MVSVTGELATFGSNAAFGALVTSLDHRELGIGKVTGLAAGRVVVEYFDSIVHPVALRVEVTPDRLRPAPLDRQHPGRRR